MIVLCNAQRESAYKLLTSTSTFFRSICKIGFTCPVCIILEISSLLSKDYPGLLSALLDEHDFRVHGLL